MLAWNGLNSVVGKLAVAGAALWLVTASPASATVITATYTGTVNESFDSTGVFGTPGADLAGVGYSLVFTIDDTVGTYSTFHGTLFDPILSGDQIIGGGVSAALTINGHSLGFADPSPLGMDFDWVASKPGFVSFAHAAGSLPTGYIEATMESTNPGPGFPTSVYTDLALSASDCPAASCVTHLAFFMPDGFHGFLNFGALTVAATPIPAALPLLVSALGGLGFVGWRRKKAVAA